jgi:hypothetical protein
MKVTMKKDSWWNVETMFVTSVGALMAVMLSAFLFAKPPVSSAGSNLVPAKALERAVQHQKECQTRNDEHPATRC